MSKVLKILGALVLLLVLLGGGAVGYAAATAEGRLAFPDAGGPTVLASTDPEVIERGRYLVNGPAHCAQCHAGDANRPPDRRRPQEVSELPLAGGLDFPMGPLGVRYARNLTPDPETGLGRYSDQQIARVLRTGVLPNGEMSFFMRLAASDLSEEDVTAVLSYLRSLPPVRNEVPAGQWFLFGKVLLTYAFPPLLPRGLEGPAHVPPSDEPSVARGEYLADRVALCSTCHTATDPMSFEIVGPKAGGSLPEASHGPDDPDMEFVAPNLTSHPSGVTGRLSEDEFVARMQAGRAFPSSIMPWENLGNTTESDLRSIYRYLRTLPPADRDLGPSYRAKGWKP